MAERMYCVKCRMYVHQDIRTINLCPRCGGVLQRHIYDPDEFFDRKLTNADRIRQMSDEELADWLGVYCNGQTAQEVGKPCVSDMGSCEECWLDWLKQEAKE